MKRDLKKLANNSQNCLWSYSLTHYARAGVSDQCLSLQDDYEANINILLLCCWLGSNGSEIGNKDLVAAWEKIMQWDACIVKPLRQARKFVASSALMEDGASVVVQLKDLELAAEKTTQEILYFWTQTQDFTTHDVIGTEWQIANLNSYLTILDAPKVSAENPLLFHANVS
ncbi:MAG: hypothetical protein ACJA2R_000273 [Saprospiraceae bacterium]|jgi:uncharacterized protein (TIGR02444 family)